MTSKIKMPMLLPDKVENFLTETILNGRCTQQFILKLREMLLLDFGKCPECDGKGIITTRQRGAIQQSGCDACNGEGWRKPHQ